MSIEELRIDFNNNIKTQKNAKKSIILPQKENLLPKKENLLPKKENLLPKKENISKKKGIISNKKSIISKKKGIISNKKSIISKKKGIPNSKNKQFICDFCNKKFSHKTSMYKHQKHICKHKSNTTINNNNITNDNSKHITNNIDNSTTNNIVNITLVVNDPGYETLEHICDKKIHFTINSSDSEGHAKMLLDLITKLHFHPDHPENYNTICPHQKNDTVFVKKINTFRKDDIGNIQNDLIDNVVKKATIKNNEFIKKHKPKLKPNEIMNRQLYNTILYNHKFYKKYLYKDLKNILYNGSKSIITPELCSELLLINDNENLQDKNKIKQLELQIEDIHIQHKDDLILEKAKYHDVKQKLNGLEDQHTSNQMYIEEQYQEIQQLKRGLLLTNCA